MGEDDKKPVQPPSPHRDRLLEVVVVVVNGANDSTDGRTVQGITLAVNGLLISGKIISERDFVLSNETLNTVEEEIGDLASEAPGPGDVEYYIPHEFFIHLKEAKIFTPGQKPMPSDGPGIFWRVKLSSIDGFSMDTLAAPTP
jgi:hypothetical protein